jgi:hypothetical protein
MALLPYCFFVAPGTTGRYMYVAAMGFSMLAAELIGRLAVRAGAWAGPRLAVLAAGVLVIAAAARFASFTAHTTPSAAEAGRPYRAWLESFRASHPTLPRGGSIDVDDPKQAAIDSRSLQPMLQLEYGDPDLRVQVRSR